MNVTEQSRNPRYALRQVAAFASPGSCPLKEANSLGAAPVPTRDQGATNLMP